MWQIAVAAAVAGSGIIAKHLFSPNSETPTPKTNQTHPKQEVEVEEEQAELLQPFQISNIFPQTQKRSNFSSFLNQNENESENAAGDGVFWFTSSGSDHGSEYLSGSKKLRLLGKKSRCSGKKIGGFDKNVVLFDDQRKSCGRRVSVYLKRRKTTRKTNDCSSFGWGLGLGMMYMMSTGKADISKLSSTIDETAKVVHELKYELNKQRPAPCCQPLNSDDTRNTVDTVQKPVVGQANIQTKNISHLADSGCASSVLTEEQHHDGAEMDQLEAEHESELQKLPWCTTETFENVENTTKLAQIERRESVNQSSTSFQSDGVSPSELKNKLSILLVEQQESHISELETELSSAYSKLQQKETELQALKDCVKCLTEFSLSTVSDDESEVCREKCGKLDHDNNEITDNATVGTKRAMHSGRTYEN